MGAPTSQTELGRMDGSEAPLWRCTGNPTETQRTITRRTVLSGAAGLAALALARSGFAQAPAENALTMGRNGTMDIKRNGSPPPGERAGAWLTRAGRAGP